MSFTETKSDFIDDEDFATAGTYTPLGYTPGGSNDSTVYGIFDKTFVSTEEIEGYKPTFLIDTDSISDIQVGDLIVITGVDYVIKDWENDGSGFTVLILEDVNIE